MTSLERSSLNQERAPITQLEKKYVNLPGQMSRKALILTALLAATLMLFGCRRAPSAVEVIATAAVIDDASEQSPTQDGGASQATLQLDPASGGAGTQINISGQGWTPGEEVNFILADQGGRSDVLATDTVSADGTLAISLAYPTESRWNTPGNYFVLGYTPNHALEVTAAFVVAEGSTDGDDSADSGATATPAPISRGGGGGSSSGDSSSPSSGDASKGGVEPTATSVAVTGARITIDPSSGTANTEVLVTCIDFPANTRVNVHLAGLVQTRGGATSESPYVYASTTTNAQGGCRMIFPMPSTWPDGRPLQSGELTVMVATEDFGTRGTATFAYVAPVPTATPTSTHTATATSTATATNTATATHTATSTSTPTATNTPIPTATPTARPYVTIEPATGGAGTAVTVNCGGYPANAQLNVYLAGLVQTRGGSSQSPTAYASVTTNADGDCPAFSFSMPSTWPDGRPIETGELSVLLATSNFAVRASDTFDYVAAPTPVARAPYADVIPASGGAGSLVTVTGGGFPAGERINIHLGKFDGQIGGGVVITYGSGVSDSNGDFTVRFTLPATWPDGSTIESSKILIVAANPGMEIQASAVFDYIKSSGPLPVATSTSTHTPTSVATNTPTSAPTSTATNTPAPASAQNGWNASYWNNTSLSGSPVLNRVDSAINFNWESGSPAAAVTANNFSARWTRTVDLQAGVYVFAMTMDDGARVYVDDQLVIDEWRLGSERTVRTDAYLSAGSHTIRVEYFERSERALIKFELEGTNLGWRGEYFPNATLSGTPALVRTDPEINFFWETGSPGSAIPVDQFSARWTREINFAAGVYRFNALADDGIRIWIDQTMILDEWHDSRSETYSVDVSLPAGPHTVRVEYYENTLGARVRVYWEDRDSASAAAPTAPVPTATWTPVPPTPTFTPVPPTATPANDANTIKVFTVAISNGRDDAEQQGDGRIKHDSDELEMTLHDSGQQIIGLRYQNLPIPQGAVVVAAYIDFTAEAVTTSPTSLLFQGESVDSAARYERDNFNISYREQTGARIAWTNVPGWSNVGQASRSPNLAAILQEIVNRPGWRPGNAVSFIISGEGLRIAESYDGNPGGAARLTVEFR